MKHITFTGTVNSTYKVALLIKESALKQANLEQHYIEPLKKAGVLESSIIAYSLTYNDKNKAPAKLIKESIQNILKACKSQDINTLIVADGNYFKTLTKERKSEPHYGYVKPCKISGYEHINVLLSVNYQALFYNPDIQSRLDLSLKALSNHINGINLVPGRGIIHSTNYPKTIKEITDSINSLHQYPALTCDIEGYGLSIKDCGVATIAFAWDKHNGMALKVETQNKGLHMKNSYADHTKDALKEFFKTYKGILIFHNASFDIKHLIFNLYMNGVYSNYKALINGLKVFYRSIHDTKILVYLATNNAQGNHLSLKHNAFEFAGNYAQEDIADISNIPMNELLEYNLIDALATWYVFDKFYPKVVKDKQIDIYNEIMIPSLKVITKMELVGMPLNKENVDSAQDKLNKILIERYYELNQIGDVIKEWEWARQLENFISGNAKLKKKINPIEKFVEKFNPNSTKHVRELLYNHIGLDIVDKTDTGLAATGNKTLKKLSNQLISKFGITEEDLK